MENKKNDQADRGVQHEVQHDRKKFPLTASHERYTEPEPILDPSCGFEEMDRGEGMGVDDVKTYHRTEK